MGLKVSFREHRQADGEKILYARFKIPIRQEDGSIGERRVERSTGHGKRVDAKKWAEAEYQREYEIANKPREGEVPSDTFAAAALSYMRNTGAQTSPVDGLIPEYRLKVRANKKYLFPIIEGIGTTKIADISQAVLDKLAEDIYPGRTAATINRQLYTPVIAVLRFKKIFNHGLQRPAGHDSLPPLDIPVDEWYARVLPVSNPYLRAFLITERMTGRRPDELLNRTRDHYNPDLGALAIWDGKAKQYIMLQLPEPAVIAINALPDLRYAKKGETAPGKRLTHSKRNFLFGTNHKTTMRTWLLDACKEAKVRYHMPKEAGRHAFVTRNLEDGKSLKWVQDAGRWKTLKIVAEKYGHLEKQDVDRQAREAGAEWFRKMLAAPKLLEAPSETVSKRGDMPGDGQENDGKSKGATPV